VTGLDKGNLMKSIRAYSFQTTHTAAAAEWVEYRSLEGALTCVRAVLGLGLGLRPMQGLGEGIERM
jgi:hypothetical protein